jgi:hypothetical protein
MIDTTVPTAVLAILLVVDTVLAQRKRRKNYRRAHA